MYIRLTGTVCDSRKHRSGHSSVAWKTRKRQFLNHVNQEQRGNVKKIVQILVGTRRPLHVEEMTIALGIATPTQLTSLHKAKPDPSRLKTNIRDWCGLLVSINHDRTYLIHRTAKEFLICHGTDTIPLSGWRHGIDPVGIGKALTRICVESLLSVHKGTTAQSLLQRFQRFGRTYDILDWKKCCGKFLGLLGRTLASLPTRRKYVNNRSIYGYNTSIL